MSSLADFRELTSRLVRRGLASADMIADDAGVVPVRRAATMRMLRFDHPYTLGEADGFIKGLPVPPEAFVCTRMPLHEVEMRRGEPWPLYSTTAEDRAKIRDEGGGRTPGGTVAVWVLNTRWWRNLAGSPCHPADERIVRAEALNA